MQRWNLERDGSLLLQGASKVLGAGDGDYSLVILLQISFLEHALEDLGGLGAVVLLLLQQLNSSSHCFVL